MYQHVNIRRNMVTSTWTSLSDIITSNNRVVNDSGAVVSPGEPDAATNRTVDAYYVEIESSTTVVS
jgi:hypothetical protein